LIFGDYDTDGIGSSAILIKYFREIGVEVNYYLPSRYNDGYGLTIDAIKKINELYKPELIITVDCGISCKKEIEFANDLGIDVIVTDHHDIPKELPKCLILDAKMENEKYPFKSLCGAGVALKLVEALSSLEECKKYFTIASISTIADIVSLTDENRFIVTYGLQNFDKFCPKGVKLLIKKLKIYSPNSSDISSKLAPKLNAAGRMGDASIALDLYINDNDKLLNQRVADIINMNTKRKDLCDDVYFDVSKMISKMDIDSMHSIIMYNKNWGVGILGIVAAKIADEYKKPTFLFSYDERTGNLTGSGRSIDGVDLHEGLTLLSDLLVSFGGHYIAAGLSLKEDNLSKFISKFEDFASEKMSKIEDPNTFI
jgi:single-stranded-DNA-specific exonuclease